MSADHAFTMTTAALLKAAELYRACPTFHTERDGSRHRCSECNQPEVAHIIVALRTALQPGDTLAAVRGHLVDAINAAGLVETRSQVQADAVTHLESKIDDLLREIDVMTEAPEPDDE